jgi:uncharacterized BrkB/YihY/UPF0761 family membrane protein
MALMFWIYLIALATLAGAELNAELAKRWEGLVRGTAGQSRTEMPRAA